MFQSYAFTNRAASWYVSDLTLIKGVAFGSSNEPANPNQTCLLGDDQYYFEVLPEADGNVVSYRVNFTVDIPFEIYEVGLFDNECSKRMFFRGVFRRPLVIENVSNNPITFVLKMQWNSYP